MEQAERMTLLVERLTHGNQRQFATVTGIQHATVNRLCKGIIKLNERYIEQIVSVWPSLNPDFLRGLSEDTGLPETPRESYAHALEMKDLEIEHLKDKISLLTWVLETLIGQQHNKGIVDNLLKNIDGNPK